VAPVGQYNCRHNESVVLYARTSRKLAANGSESDCLISRVIRREFGN
jgi:hypothetical protein